MVLARESDARRAQAVLMSIEGVERIVSRMEMPSYHLPTLYEHDLFIFAKEDFVLGSWEGQERRKKVRGLRSHGSFHEGRVPLLFVGAGVRPGARLDDASNVDIAPTLAHLLNIKRGDFQGRIQKEAIA